MKKDNSTLPRKLALRMIAVRELGEKCRVLETHGGLGEIYKQAYRGTTGVVIEKDPDRSAALALQRPDWIVYQADAAVALACGAGSGQMTTLLDVDPYGDPWPVIAAFFGSAREFAPSMFVAVNDGLRLKAKLRGGWSCASLRGAAQCFGNDALYDNYLMICERMMTEKAAVAGYSIGRFRGYYCGHAGQMTHYLTRLEMR